VDAAVLEKSGGGAARVEKRGETGRVEKKSASFEPLNSGSNGSHQNNYGAGRFFLKRKTPTHKINPDCDNSIFSQDHGERRVTEMMVKT
jgi:hypothetical protein